MTIRAMGRRRTNAALIVDCAVLGYLRPEWAVCDPTYGEGRFWRAWRPAGLVASDIDPAKSPVGWSINFRALPWADDRFDATVLDVPYKLNGTGGSHPSDAGYGVANNGNPTGRHDLAFAGITECVRVTRPRGMVLVKGKNQVYSGRKVWQIRLFEEHLEGLGCRIVDELHVESYIPQPKGRRQLHAHVDYSTLIVAEVPAA